MLIDIKKIARLAHLKVQEDEIAGLEKEMESILNMVNDLPEKLDEKLTMDSSNPMILREDVVVPSYKRDLLLQNTPKAIAGCIIVPKIVD